MSMVITCMLQNYGLACARYRNIKSYPDALLYVVAWHLLQQCLDGVCLLQTVMLKGSSMNLRLGHDSGLGVAVGGVGDPER